MSGWIGVDLDGTLAEYDGWNGPRHIGPPVPEMLFRVKEWLDNGQEVRIYTARVSHDGTADRKLEAALAHQAIELWCLEHVGQILPVTNQKDYGMIECWDDRSVAVERNTGSVLGRNV